MVKLRLNKIKPQPKKLTLAKVRLIARLKGDGSVFISGKRKTNYFISYESNDENELNQFSNDEILELTNLVNRLTDRLSRAT